MLKILIVDDSVFSQRVTANFIKNYFHDVMISYANNGEEGYEKYKEIEPDYTFLDLLMPKLNGAELIKLIKGYKSDAKIFVLTADVQKSVRAEIEAFNILAYINKPFNEEKAQFVFDVIREDTNE